MAVGIGSVKRMVRSGDSVKDIIKFWLPEVISQFVFIVFPLLLDSYIVAGLKSTTLYGALGTANNFIHVLLKFSEAIPIASVAIIGRLNGAKKYNKCGEELGNTFWTSTFFGVLQFILIFFAATQIYRVLGVPESMISIGAPFLQLRSFGIMLVFLSQVLLYFMRGIKNTKTPMIISLTGILSFAFFDYALVLGRLGCPRLGLHGAAIATIIQYSFVMILSLWLILSNKSYKKYFASLFIGYFTLKRSLHLLNLSWQIMVDKTSLALSYVWLFKMITHMGPAAIASFDAIKNLERFALLPAIAFAQVITFLVSNRLGAGDPEGAKSNIKKVLFMTFVATSICLLGLCLKASFFIGLFDKDVTNSFGHIAAPALVLVSALVVFDFIQLILAGALRGAGDVRTVMIVRFFSCLLFFTPIAYIISKLPITNLAVRFGLIYGTFYLNTAVIGFFFMRRIVSGKWQKIKV
ncbi:MATE family efflux transporter [Candidatus Dependentiae bacterium]|nr:MATE family efflux transporter [Candidatus Dependentiae bacterium]